MSAPTEAESSRPKAGKAPAKRKSRPLQYYNILVHRYLGYLFLGTTVVYAISGLAVNHIEDWNPNLYPVRQTQAIQPLADPENLSEAEAKAIFAQFGVSEPFNPENVFYPDDHNVEILVTSSEKIFIRLNSWQAEHEVVHRRPVLHLFNYLHLNNAKKGWTLYADLYAIALLLIAITGLFMKKGKKGLWGEASIWIVAGMVLPAILVLVYYR